MERNGDQINKVILEVPSAMEEARCEDKIVRVMKECRLNVG